MRLRGLGWRSLLLLTLAGCPSSFPPPPTPAPEAGDSAPIFVANRTAAAVFADLQASGCNADGGLVYVEQAHARYDRSPVWDCLFLSGGSVHLCGCP